MYIYIYIYNIYTYIYSYQKVISPRCHHTNIRIPIRKQDLSRPSFLCPGNPYIHETWPYHWHRARAPMSKLHFSVYFGLCETYTYCYWWKTTLSVDVQRGTCKDQVLPVFFSDHFCTTSYHRFLSPLRLIARSREVSKPRDFIYNRPIALIFGRHLGNTAAEVPVKFQSDAII